MSDFGRKFCFDVGEKKWAEVAKLQSMCPDEDFREVFLRGEN